MNGLPIGIAATAWSAVIGALLWRFASDRGLWAGLVCGAPALLSLVLSFTNQADRGQYQARLFASAGLLPVALLVFALGDGAPMWPAAWWLLLALALLHVLAFVGGTLLIASWGTVLEAAPGVAPLLPSQLGTRLRSLQAVPVALRLRATVSASDVADSWVIELNDPADPGRSHRVLLQIDGARHRVAVRERLAGSGAPRSADEASMRGPVDAAFDPARPQARVAGARVAQATVVEAPELAGVRLHWADDGSLARVELPTIAGDEGQAWLTLIAAVVTRSGYAWRPRLFGRGG